MKEYNSEDHRTEICEQSILDIQTNYSNYWSNWANNINKEVSITINETGNDENAPTTCQN